MIQFASLLIAICFFSCSNTSKIKSTSENLNEIKFTVEAADDWTALFKREHGWFGGDGIFFIPLNGRENICADDSSETLILFSDTVIGDIINDS
ncbi:MAG TPA: hypothetical protein PL045_13310, partial [Chitinophagaceae bacterium]|nr:hypothetical protein [Chitinophagaceae bacterium]